MPAETIRILSTDRLPLHPRDLLQNLGPIRRERFSGTGAANQTSRLAAPAAMIHEVLIHGNTLATPGFNRRANHAASLAGTQDFTFANNTITWGNSTVGYKPTANDVVDVTYSTKDYYAEETTLSFAGTIASGATYVSPGTDTAIYIDGADRISVALDTTATTYTGNLDLHAIWGHDSTTFYRDTQTENFVAGIAINKQQRAALTPGPKYLKIRADNNAGAIPTGNSLTVKVRAVWYLKG